MPFAFISAISNIVATTVNKHLLSIQKMNVAVFSAWLFIILFLITSLALPWLGWINLEQALTPYYLFLFMIMILIAAIWNYFYYTCLEKEHLGDFQVISIVQPLMMVVLSMLVFADERNFKVIMAAIIAGIVLVWSHLSRWKIENFRVTIPLFFAIFLAAIESLYHKELLGVYSPVALYFVRTGFIALIFVILSYQNITQLTKSNVIQTIIIAIFAVSTMVLSFYGYQTIGIAKTQIIMLLYPVGATLLSVYYLHERIKKRKIFALIIIVACIIYAFS